MLACIAEEGILKITGHLGRVNRDVKASKYIETTARLTFYTTTMSHETLLRLEGKFG